MAASEDSRVGRAALVVAVFGFGFALAGVYWDDAWHTDRGRDDLLSPPHVSLYLGVAMVAGVVIWLARPTTGSRWPAWTGPAGLGVTGAAATLGSAPIDEWWHQTFGRDAVLWSPPHLAAVAGTIALGTSVALMASTASPSRPSPMALAARSGVVGAWLVLVLEYDTDVAQFSALWYLPVLAVALAAAAVTVRAASGSRMRWAATAAGLGYTIAMVGLVIGLSLADFSAPIVPIVIPALAVTDVGCWRGWSAPARALSFVVVLFASYWPYLGVVPGGVQPAPGEAIVGIVLGWAGVVGVLFLMDPSARIRPHRPTIVASLAFVVASTAVVVDSSSTAAHDPGQGDEVVDVTLVADVRGHRVEVVARVGDTLDAVEPVRLVARRGGRTLVGSLAPDADGWAGAIDLDEDGRWFVYVEARRGDDRLEAWIPVIAGSTERESKTTALYLAAREGDVPATQVAAGTVLLALVAVLVVRIALAVRAECTKFTTVCRSR